MLTTLKITPTSALMLTSNTYVVDLHAQRHVSVTRVANRFRKNINPRRYPLFAHWLKSHFPSLFAGCCRATWRECLVDSWITSQSLFADSRAVISIRAASRPTFLIGKRLKSARRNRAPPSRSRNVLAPLRCLRKIERWGEKGRLEVPIEKQLFIWFYYQLVVRVVVDEMKLPQS